MINAASHPTLQQRVRDVLIYIMLMIDQGHADVTSPSQVGKAQTAIESVQFSPAPEQPPAQRPERNPDPPETP
jgi:hypothetical protein